VLTLAGAAVDMESVMVAKFPKVFEKRDATPAQLPAFSIHTGDAQPVYSFPYRYDEERRAVIAAELPKMVAAGVIVPSTSPWASPLLLVPKGEAWRLCVDYRKLNAVTEPDRFPLPRVDFIFSLLSEAVIMSVLDLRSGYWQMPMEQASRAKTAFICHLGLFEWQVLPFGVRNGPPKFQRAVQEVLGDALFKHAVAYLDDIVVFSASAEEHHVHVEDVLTRLAEAGLLANTEKCQWAKESVTLLGFIVGGGQIRPDPEKVVAIKEFPMPTSRKQLQSWLGLANYFRAHVPEYAATARPLYAILQAKVFSWSEEAHTAFEQLRDALVNMAALNQPVSSAPFVVQSDASEVATGAVLLQEGRAIAFHSRLFSGAELKYTTLEKELLACVYAVRRFEAHVGLRPFVVETDHKNIVALVHSKLVDLSVLSRRRIARWLLLLDSFNIEWRHLAGAHNVVADALSRPYSAQLSLAFAAAAPSLEDIEVEQDCAEVEEWRARFHLVRQGAVWHKRTRRGLLVVVPSTLRDRVLAAAHDNQDHVGATKVKAALRAFWWPSWSADIEEWCRTCDHCQRRAAPARGFAKHGLLQPIVSDTVFQLVGLDFTGPFPRSPDGLMFVCTVRDHFSGFVVFHAVADQTAAAAVEALVHWATTFGLPRAIVTDRGSAFTSAAMDLLCEALGTELRHTTAFHPQANGVTEIVHKAMKKVFIDEQWPAAVRHLAFTLNTTKAHMAYTPFEVLFGVQARTALDLDLDLAPPEEKVWPNIVEEVVGRFRQLRDDVARDQEYQRELSRHYYDVGRETVLFNVGDEVLLRRMVHRGVVRKELVPFAGPFQVTRVISPIVYELDIDGKAYVATVQRLKAYQRRGGEAPRVGVDDVVHASDDDDDDDDDGDDDVDADGDVPAEFQGGSLEDFVLQRRR